MFNWFKKLFGKEEQKQQTQVVDSGSVAIQYGGDIIISTPGNITLSAKTVETPRPSPTAPPVAAVKRTPGVPLAPKRNPAPHASAARSPSRTSSDYRRNDYDNSPSLTDYAVMHAVTSSSYDNSSSYSSSSSSDSCSSYSSSDSSSSSSDSGSCGGGD